MHRDNEVDPNIKPTLALSIDDPTSNKKVGSMANFVPVSITDDSAFKARMDETDPCCCCEGDLRRLINDAPDQYTLGFLCGVATVRQQLAILGICPL